MSSGKKKKTNASTGSRRTISPEERRRKADELVTRALDSIDEGEQRRLAREATKLDPDCSDAWSLLGDLASDDQEALPYYEKAVAAIDREVGEQLCSELEAGTASIDDGHAWFLWRCDLAYALYGVGRIQESIDLLNILLRLAPEDDAGLRYLLAKGLLHEQRHKELAKLLRRYDNDPSCAWKFTRSLLLFRTKGYASKSCDALVDAHNANHYVADYLIGPESLPDEVPDLINPGTKAEAAEYVRSFITEWQQTKGAIEWLCDVLDDLDLTGPDDLLDSLLPGEDLEGEDFDFGFVEVPQLHWRELLPRVRRLPPAQPSDWSIDLVRISFEADGEVFEWVVAVVDSSTRLPLMLQPFHERPRDTEVFDVLLKAIFEPTTGRAARPASIRMKRKGFFNAWQKRLEGVGIRCELADELPHIDLATSLLLKGARAREESRDLGGIDDDRLRSLPQDGTTWVALVRPLSTWVRADDRVVRPWIRLIADATNRVILSSTMNDTQPSSDWLKEGLAVAMLVSESSDARRPETIFIDPPEFADELKPWLEKLEVECLVDENPDGLNRLVEEFTNQMAGPGRAPALVKTTGMTTEMVAALFGAAWTYYMLRPWDQVSEGTILKVECDAWESGPWYANVLGHSGRGHALTLYEDRAFVERLVCGHLSHDETARKISSLALTFSHMYDLSPDDVDAADEHEWLVADEAAWPNVIRVNPGMSRRAALPWEVELLIACLLAIPLAVSRDGIQTGWQEVETVGRKVGVHLSVVSES